MIIGSGMIAKAFNAYIENKEIIIFASGVSNSSNTISDEYEREKELLKKSISENKSCLLVYFSTCSVYDDDSKSSDYVLHKLRVEDLIKNSGINFLILRVSNVVGSTGNPNTIFNYIRNKIIKGESFNLWKHACRNFIDVDDLTKISQQLIQAGLQNRVINVANSQSILMMDFVTQMEKHLNITSLKNIVEKGKCVDIDVSELEECIGNLDLFFEDNYLQKLLNKYAK